MQQKKKNLIARGRRGVGGWEGGGGGGGGEKERIIGNSNVTIFVTIVDQCTNTSFAVDKLSKFPTVPFLS